MKRKGGLRLYLFIDYQLFTQYMYISRKEDGENIGGLFNGTALAFAAAGYLSDVVFVSCHRSLPAPWHQAVTPP
ncbi:hypothetical protein [Pseudoalteromonas sp. T1lg48]|uniref:hypothetical protein n=1 Tax=Pseudoalteromonas sp. T1lg48 TaxID=2077100 RepID=UPI000CF6D1A7|nr:hypothetical protein [Pseudoalteromonas sp. T1lg48]